MQNMIQRIWNGFQKYYMNYAKHVVVMKGKPSLLLPAFPTLKVK